MGNVCSTACVCGVVCVLCANVIYVSGFEKRDHFALCIKCHYKRKHTNESCFQ